MNEEHRYATPVALHAAITDRLRSAARRDPSRSLADLRRQFAYDRLLYRIFTGEGRERWVLKGATALLARLGGQARHSVDIDLYDQTGNLTDAEAALQAAAARDAGDQFRFALAPGRRIAQGGVALRVPATAYLGATEFERFNVDLAAGAGMTGEPDEADPLVPVEIPGIPQARYRVYPLADHVADKVFGIVERHARQDGPAIASTRYRDLTDLVLIARRERVEAQALEAALRAQAERRRLGVPSEFRPPDDSLWRSGYARIAKDVANLEEKEFDAAVETARRFVEPVLKGVARGRWNPDRQAWME
jgi:nucleotidyltransferase AbiEii toxin of type IV toxin-antitoxin system